MRAAKTITRTPCRRRQQSAGTIESNAAWLIEPPAPSSGDPVPEPGHPPTHQKFSSEPPSRESSIVDANVNEQHIQAEGGDRRRRFRGPDPPPPDRPASRSSHRR